VCVGGTSGRVAELDSNLNLVAEHPTSEKNIDNFSEWPATVSARLHCLHACSVTEWQRLASATQCTKRLVSPTWTWRVTHCDFCTVVDCFWLQSYSACQVTACRLLICHCGSNDAQGNAIHDGTDCSGIASAQEAVILLQSLSGCCSESDSSSLACTTAYPCRPAWPGPEPSRHQPHGHPGLCGVRLNIQALQRRQVRRQTNRSE
jgi:hypothetical protein